MSSNKKHPPFKPLSTFLDIQAASGVSLHSLVTQLRRIQAVWSTVVATDLAEHARPSYYDDGRLTITADSPVWANSVRHSQQSLVKRLRRLGLSELKSIRVAILPPQASRQTPPIRRPRPSAAVRAALKTTAEGVQDPELRSTLLKLRDTLGGSGGKR